jgi:hypothetical protein
MASLDEAYFPVYPQKERRKKRRHEGFENRRSHEGFGSTESPRLPPPEPSVIEPDRPAHRRLPPAELLGAGPTEYTYTPPSAMLNAMDVDTDSPAYFPHPNKDIQNEQVYMLEPDWANQFNGNSAPDWIKQRMASKDAEIPLTPSPWMDGGPTLWQQIPKAKAQVYDPMLLEAEDKATKQFDQLQSRLDMMFEKLTAMETTRSTSNHVEILMFVLGGIFLLLMLDLLVKQGTKATMLVAAAGGGSAQFARAALGL